MNLDLVPIWAFFVCTILLVMVFMEVGYRLGSFAHKKSPEEKESPISGVAGAVLGLSAFILAFTFSIVGERYETRKGLVRDDANAIRVAYVRADFVPEPDRSESKQLLKAYVDRRLAMAKGGDTGQQALGPFLADSDRIQRRLWDIAVANAERDMNSDVAALYIEALNDLSEAHATRLAIAVRTRLPLGIWVVLYSLTIFGMVSMGYHAGIAGSKRSRATWIVAISFGMVIAMIASLDRPSGFIKVSQQPLVDVREMMSAK